MNWDNFHQSYIFLEMLILAPPISESLIATIQNVLYSLIWRTVDKILWKWQKIMKMIKISCFPGREEENVSEWDPNLADRNLDRFVVQVYDAFFIPGSDLWVYTSCGVYKSKDPCETFMLIPTQCYSIIKGRLGDPLRYFLGEFSKLVWVKKEEENSSIRKNE